MPPALPAFLLAEIEAAARRLDELTAAGRELAYHVDGSTGRARVDVRDADGRTVGELSPARALDVVAGAPLE